MKEKEQEITELTEYNFIIDIIYFNKYAFKK